MPPRGRRLRSRGARCGAFLAYFWFGFAPFAFSGLAQVGQLFGVEFSEAARLLVEDQGAIADAANLFDEELLLLMTEGGAMFAMSYYGANRVVPNYNVMGPVKAALEDSLPLPRL